MKATKRGKTGYEICILAGGLSERMGRDKSRLRLGGRSMLGQIRTEATRTGVRVRVIRRDLVPRCGPVGGVYTALKTTQADAVVFLACDMPFVTAGLIDLFVTECAKGRSSRRGDRDGVFALGKGEVGFPFLLQRKALHVVAGQIERGELSLQALAKALKGKRLRLPARA